MADLKSEFPNEKTVVIAPAAGVSYLACEAGQGGEDCDDQDPDQSPGFGC